MNEVSQLMNSINIICNLKGKHYSNYSCKSVSWDDVSRYTSKNSGGSIMNYLSCWGSNITDTRLISKDGKILYTVRPDNWNEKLGHIDADEIAIVVEDPDTKTMTPITLKDYLSNISKYGKYAGVGEGTNLYNPDLDTKVSIRFQTTFLPVPEESTNNTDDFEVVNEQTMQFCPESYNYNTSSSKDPRNMLILATTQGVALQQDSSGYQKLFHHAVDEDGKIHRYWYEAEKSGFKVGGEQKETKEQAEEVLSRGKAISSIIGTKGMGQRFNALLTIQVPIKKKNPVRNRGYEFELGKSFCLKSTQHISTNTVLCSSNMSMLNTSLKKKKCISYGGMRGGNSRSRTNGQIMTGISNAARVSRGTESDTWKGLERTEGLERDPVQHITITVVLYNTVTSGIPSEEDVIAAIDDLENLYESCNWKGKLAEHGSEISFMHEPVNKKVDVNPKTVSYQPTPTWELETRTTFPVSVSNEVPITTKRS